MSQPSPTAIFSVDRLTLGLYAALVTIGWLMIYAATYNPDTPLDFLDLDNTAGKQLGFILFCAVMMYVVMLAEWTFWRTLALPLYLISVLLLPGTLIFGREVNPPM